MDTASYFNYYEIDGHYFYWERTDLKEIKIFPSQNTKLTVEGLLNMSLPFGYVTSVQKIVKDGFIHGVVIYSNADDAAFAMEKLNGTKDFFVGLLKHREVRGPHKVERSGSPRDQPPCLLQDRFSDMPPQRLPSLLTLYPSDESVCLRIRNLPKCVDERYQVLRLLPPSTTSVKTDRRSAIVTLSDFSSAWWLMAVLKDLYTGSKCLRVSLVPTGVGACNEDRTQKMPSTAPRSALNPLYTTGSLRLPQPKH